MSIPKFMQPKITITSPDHPAKVVNGKCNALLTRCQNKVDDVQCDFKYENIGETKCYECGAMRRRCRLKPDSRSMTGRCKKHSQKPAGITHFNYKGNNALSKVLPTRMLETYFMAVEGDNLLDLSDNLAILQARRNDLLSRIDERPSYEMWNDAQKEFSKLQDYYSDFQDNPENSFVANKLDSTMSKLEKIIVKGYTDSLNWKEVYGTMEHERKLNETETKRREKASTVLTEDKVRDLLGYIMYNIQNRVSNQKERQMLIKDISDYKIK